MKSSRAPSHRHPGRRFQRQLLPRRATALLAPVLLALVLLGAPSPAFAVQAFDPDRYHRQCLAFEQAGDLETARLSCLNALTADPDHLGARLTLARLELALGELGAAESSLLRASEGIPGAEAQLLLAELYTRSGRYGEAEAALAEAGRRLAATAESGSTARLAYLRGDLARRRGHFGSALASYRDAVRMAPSDRLYRVTLAALLFDLGDAEASQVQLREYLAAGGPGDAQISSLLGQALWAQGELDGAARELERAASLRSGRGSAAHADDLRALSLVYYALGDTQAGGLAMREAVLSGNLLASFFSGNLLWLLLLLLLLATHLVGESRVGATTAVDTVEGPRPWSVGQVYGVGWIALLVALPSAVLYGVVRHDNLLALLTPIQSSDSRAVLLIVFSLMAAWGSWRRAAVNGWRPRAALLSGGQRVPAGIMLGLALLAATLAYRAYLPDWQWRGEPLLDLGHLTPAIALALAIMPLSEIFFRAFAFPAFEDRYGTSIAVLISGGLSALVFATPALLLLAVGLVLATAYRRHRSGAMTVAAQATLHLGLLLAVTLVPWAHGLFV